MYLRECSLVWDCLMIIVTEVVCGKEIEVDKVTREYVIVLEGVSFKIDLIPLGHGSFDYGDRDGLIG